MIVLVDDIETKVIRIGKDSFKLICYKHQIDEDSTCHEAGFIVDITEDGMEFKEDFLTGHSFDLDALDALDKVKKRLKTHDSEYIKNLFNSITASKIFNLW